MRSLALLAGALLLLQLCCVLRVEGQYPGRRGQPQQYYDDDEDPITDRAVEYYLMQQQAAQQKMQQEQMYQRQREEEMMRQAQEQQRQQQIAYQRQQQEQAMRLAQEEAIFEAQRQAILEEEEAQYYRQQQQYAQEQQYLQQMAMQQAMQQQQQAAAQQQAANKPATYVHSSSKSDKEAYQVVFDQEQEKQKKKKGHAMADAKATTLDEATELAEHATLMMSQGSYRDSLILYDRCLAVQLSHLGDLHPMVAHTVDLMGVALLRVGSPMEALEAFQKSLAIHEQLHGPGNHPDWALAVMHVGQAYELMAQLNRRERKEDEADFDDKVERAYDMYERALDVFQSQVEEGEPDIDVANIYHCMGNIHNLRGEYMEALRKFKSSLDQKIKIIGEDEASVAWTKNNIGNAFKGMGKMDDAIKWYQESLETVTQIYGSENPEVANVHWNLAMAYLARGESVSERRKAWQELFPWVFRGAQRRLQTVREDFKAMDENLMHAFNVFVKRLGEDHVSTQRATLAMIELNELKNV